MSGKTISEQELAALKDAHRSLNHGGLIEMPSGPLDHCWTAMNPLYKKRHTFSTVDALRSRGMLTVTGTPGERNACITEAGLLELDLLGASE